MTFADFSNNEAVIMALKGMVDSNKVPHALMLHSNDGGDGLALAIGFLQYLYCSSHSESDSCGVCPNCNKVSKLIHADIHYVFPVALPSSSSSASQISPSEAFISQFRELATTNVRFTEQELYSTLGFEGKNPVISVAESNALIRTLSMHSLEGGYSSVVIYLPEKMNTAAANKLLKMLEEPPEKTLFVLLTHSPERLLPTIVSRCQMFRVLSSNNSVASLYDDGGALSSLMQALLSRDLAAALAVGERLASAASRENAKSFCRYAAEKFRRVFLYSQGLNDLQQDDPEARTWAASLNARFPRKALEVLDRSLQRIDRNVNLKIIFTDLVDRLFIQI